MSFERQLFGGAWFYRLDPRHEWIPMSLARLSELCQNYEKEINQLTADRDRWKGLAECACEIAEECYPYVDEYFRNKWGLSDDIVKMRKLKSEMEAE